MAFCPFRSIEFIDKKTKEKRVEFADCHPDCALCIPKNKLREVYGDLVMCEYDTCALTVLALTAKKLYPDEPNDNFRRRF